MRYLILILALTGCSTEGPTIEEQTAFISAQIESTLIRMKCEAKCDMQMPMPGSRVSTLNQPTNGWDAVKSLGNNTVQIIPWLATWGITTKGYDTIESIVSSFPSGATSNVTTSTTNTTTTGDTITTTTGDTIATSGDTNSGNSTSGDTSSVVGDAIDSSGSGNDSSVNTTTTTETSDSSDNSDNANNSTNTP